MDMVERVTNRYVASTRPVVFLDFDETLVHVTPGDRDFQLQEAEKELHIRLQIHRKINTPSTQQMVDEAMVNFQHKAHTDLPEITLSGGYAYTVHPRPGLNQFLEVLSSFADLYLLSAGSPPYLEEAVPAVGIDGYFQEIFSVRGEKDIPLRQTNSWVLVDDLPIGSDIISAKQRMLQDYDPNRIVSIPPYEGGVDTVLPRIVGDIQDRLLWWSIANND